MSYFGDYSRGDIILNLRRIVIIFFYLNIFFLKYYLVIYLESVLSNVLLMIMHIVSNSNLIYCIRL